MIQRQRKIQGMETQWFPASKEVQDTEVIKQSVGAVFWDKDGILLVDYLEKGATITAKYYVALLSKLKQQLVSKYRGKLSKGILFLQDNAAPHKAAITHPKFAHLHFEVLKYLAYSPDLAPSDYYLFPNLKTKGRKFLSLEEATLAAVGGFQHNQKNFSWMG
jgi:histone-lysine N-methyltransferase SETMAR